MDVVGLCLTARGKGHLYCTAEVIRRIERGTKSDFLCSQKVQRCFLQPTSGDPSMKLFLESNQRQKIDALCFLNMERNQRTRKLLKHMELPFILFYNSDDSRMPISTATIGRGDTQLKLETTDKEKQLKVLDSYFSKLHPETEKQLNSDESLAKLDTVLVREDYYTKSSPELEATPVELVDRNHDDTKAELKSLENYFGRSDTGAGAGKSITTKMSNSNMTTADMEKVLLTGQIKRSTENMHNESSQKAPSNCSTEDISTHTEDPGFYITGILAAINIAVFLFEIASPLRGSQVEHISVPLLYGAKINQLILVGEWWRLLTPMFLHSGLLHVALSCWALLTFGPQVSRRYGPFAFLLIYLLGGICGNLTSFIHTTDLTVCGTGPVFAIIGAWLVYQTQNKGLISKDISESMFMKAVIVTGLSFLLSSGGRIDDWTHVGAIMSGVIFGCFTCPTTQLDNAASSEESQKEGFTLLHKQADPWKSLFTFGAMIFLLASAVFLYETQLSGLELDDVLQSLN